MNNKKRKQGRPTSVRKEELRHRIACLYTELVLTGKSHEDVLEEISKHPFWYDTGELIESVNDGKTSGYADVRADVVGKETIKQAIKESRKFSITGDEYRSSKVLRRDPKWKGLFDYLDSTKD